MIGFGWTDFKISPSGDYLAITGRTFGSADIWLLNLNSKEAERVTLESSEEEYPVWSPDGRYIAYTSTMEGTHKILIQDLRIRGNPKQILTWPRYCHIRDWSPDGKWFALDDFSSDNGMDLYVISVDGREVIPVSATKANESYGRFSPDGKWLAFASDQNGAVETYIVSIPELKNKRQLLTSRETWMTWDHNGKQIYFRSGGSIFVQEVIIDNEIKKGEAVKLFDSQTGAFTVSPDGQKFYFHKPNLKRANPPLYLITNWLQEL
jgi:TolB protein